MLSRSRPFAAFTRGFLPRATLAATRQVHLHGALDSRTDRVPRLQTLQRTVTVDLTSSPTSGILASLRVPDPSSTNSAASDAPIYIQHVPAASATASDILNNLRHEYRGSRIWLTRGYTSTPLPPADLASIPVAQLVRGAYVLWIDDVPHVFDARAALQKLRAVRADVEGKAAAVVRVQGTVEEVEKKVRGQLNMLVIGGGVGLCTELAGIVYLTYEMGWVRRWNAKEALLGRFANGRNTGHEAKKKKNERKEKRSNLTRRTDGARAIPAIYVHPRPPTLFRAIRRRQDLMEPTSYLLGLGTVIIGATYFAVLRREYTYEAASNHLESLLQRRHARRAGLDLAAHATARETLTQLRATWDPVVRAYLPDTTVPKWRRELRKDFGRHEVLGGK
ncbi:hypothetical protein AMAG_18308 [Allomyces macrogynus ATCC 38327]|uniref:Calcium uniporter protein C-terminal domain-containing protein n=1 Tax=Allomyces macrogynus (strain ATCC 38327) TaxID=578462 RepID=A0A0L0S8S9_ALLM3|nr:hypothetical protein AMAG_18308 [Allomyces macrogynus ATCC 38327]|eukprot:KNE58809.1 hypothetical protein AMAG_18308 [Allomyces macrogynus ATCC 38327]